MKIYRYGHGIERLGQRYKLEGFLGNGGMADICLAWDEKEEREVAIKVLKSNQLDLETLNRFMYEGSLLKSWQHPHIIHIYEEARLELLDPSSGVSIPYFVMEYLPGGTLQDRLVENQPYPFTRSLIIFGQLCNALQYAHDHALIHRDLKPSNILFKNTAGSPPSLVLSDFGLAVSAQATHHTFSRAGTPPYMAPEQLQGQSVQASDIFALATIFYQLCTGQLPFQPADLEKHPLPPPALPSSLNPLLPKALDAVILKALSHDPQQRYTSADLFWQRVRKAVIASETRLKTPTRIETLLPPTILTETKKEQRPSLPFTSENAPKQLPIRDTPRPRPPLTKPSHQYDLRVSLGILFLVVLMTFSLIQSHLLVTLLHVLPIPGLFPVAHITLLPESITLSNHYTFNGSSGPSDLSTQQIQVRTLTTNVQSQSLSIQASGQNTSLYGHFATGMLTFYNSTPVTLTIKAHTILTASNGTQLWNIRAVTIPAQGEKQVPAVALSRGSTGNIAPGMLDRPCCVRGVSVKNTSAFAGGLNPGPYHFLTSTDLQNAATSSLENQLSQQALTQLKQQLSSSETLADSPQCSYALSSPDPVGDQHQDIKNSSLLITTACISIAYNSQDMHSFLAQLLTQSAHLSPLMHNQSLLLTCQLQNMTPIRLDVKASGQWLYSFDDQQKNALLNLVRGKSIEEAQTALSEAEGVSHVSIQFDDTTLPTDVDQFTLSIETPPPLPASPSPQPLEMG